MSDAVPTTVLVEITGSTERHIAGKPYSAGLGGVAAQIALVDFAKVTGSIAVLVDQMAVQLRPRPGGPAQTEVQFGMKVSAEGNVIISKLGGEASLTVKVIWDRS
jgi:hypothetical protein